MRKFYMTILCLAFICTTSAQTVVWSSDLEDTSNFIFTDQDEDTFEWIEGISESPSLLLDSGFSLGNVLYSESWRSGALYPDNRLTTPLGEITIPASAETITFKMKVAAPDPDYFDENFAVYVFDEAIGSSLDNLIYEETLTEGGVIKEIIATIPASFAGKSIGIIIRHYDSSDSYIIAIDDLEVSYSETLGIEDNNDIEKNYLVYPNPVKNILTITTDEPVKSISVFNQLGQKVMTARETEILNNTVDLSNLSQGMYVVNVTSGSGNENFTIIKE